MCSVLLVIGMLIASLSLFLQELELERVVLGVYAGDLDGVGFTVVAVGGWGASLSWKGSGG